MATWRRKGTIQEGQCVSALTGMLFLTCELGVINCVSWLLWVYKGSCTPDLCLDTARHRFVDFIVFFLDLKRLLLPCVSVCVCVKNLNK